MASNRRDLLWLPLEPRTFPAAEVPEHYRLTVRAGIATAAPHAQVVQVTHRLVCPAMVNDAQLARLRVVAPTLAARVEGA